jgi:hypothetical protein
MKVFAYFILVLICWALSFLMLAFAIVGFHGPEVLMAGWIFPAGATHFTGLMCEAIGVEPGKIYPAPTPMPKPSRIP